MNKNEVLTIGFSKEDYNTPQLNTENFANDYTGTTIGKVCSKTHKNYLLLFTILIMIFIYYFYLNWNIVFILSKSHTGLNHKFWSDNALQDKQYLKGLIYFAVFHVFFLLLLLSFYKVIFTSPGYFSQEYINIFSLKNKLSGLNLKKNLENSSDEDLFEDSSLFDNSEVERLFDTENDNKIEINKKREKLFKMMYDMIDHRSALKRICRFCLIIKPERSHHCRVCRKCVLKYDHHCKFLSNCIGFINYKYFFLFNFYCLITLLFIICTSVEGLIIYINTFGWESNYCKLFALAFGFIVLVFISITDLFIFHLIILFRGVTTVENKSRKEDELNNGDYLERMEDSFGIGRCFWWFFPTSNYNLFLIFFY